MRIFTMNLVDLSKDSMLRCDEKFHAGMTATGWNLFGTPAAGNVRLAEILQESYCLCPYDEDVEYKGIPTGQAYIDEDGDIIDFQPVAFDNHPGRLKYSATPDHILISYLRLAKSPAICIDVPNLDDYVFSNGFYMFSVVDSWEKRFVLYVLRSQKIKTFIDSNIYRGIGISSYRKADLLNIEIRNLSLAEQQKALISIKPLEISIKTLKEQIKPAQSVIDEIFEQEFGLDYATFEALSTQKRFNINMSLFANNPDLRFSAKFHRSAGAFVMKQLKDITSKKIKHYLAEPIVLGASVSPCNFNENGSTYYVSMATIKTLEIELDESQLLSNDYAKEKKAKMVKAGDIIIARSGVAIGKTALVKKEINGIFADFTMRVRLENYNTLFAYYYFRSKFFQYLIEIYKKGVQNQNIFPIVVREFPLPDISLDEQQRIVDIIQYEIDKQGKIEAEIANLRGQIDNIIEKTLTQMV